ncbi:MAG: hypothetical protein PHF50_00635 [Patescibacteria group bacterium]|nr:hypothetical protein [Patescibacteria group bacterium]
MPKEIKNIADSVMREIHESKLKMRPRFYFIIGSSLILIGLVFSVISSVFLVGLIRFSLRTHGPMGEYRFAQLIESFPWWAIILAISGLIIGVWLIRQYDFSYKINFKIIIIGFVAAIIIAGWLVDASGLNDAFSRRGCSMHRLYRQNSCLNNLK